MAYQKTTLWEAVCAMIRIQKFSFIEILEGPYRYYGVIEDTIILEDERHNETGIEVIVRFMERELLSAETYEPDILDCTNGFRIILGKIELEQQPERIRIFQSGFIRLYYPSKYGRDTYVLTPLFFTTLPDS